MFDIWLRTLLTASIFGFIDLGCIWMAPKKPPFPVIFVLLMSGFACVLTAVVSIIGLIWSM